MCPEKDGTSVSLGGGSRRGGDGAVRFLREHGRRSLVSLGCGGRLNRLDNHLRLWCALGLEHYVGVDKRDWIAARWDDLFQDEKAALDLLDGRKLTARDFLERVRLFPRTRVEDLFGIPCAAVVCQRVLPFHHWEAVVASMEPRWILQEDFHGCERQDFRPWGYRRAMDAAGRWGFIPFRPWRIFPGERNYVLWCR